MLFAADVKDWLVPTLSILGPIVVAFITSYFVLRGKKVDQKAEAPFKLITELQEEITRLSTDLKNLRTEQEDCHKERLEQAVEIAELKIQIAELKAELTSLRSNQQTIAHDVDVDLPE